MEDFSDETLVCGDTYIVFETKHIEIQTQMKQQILSESFITVGGSTRPLTKSWEERYGTHETRQHITIVFCILYLY